MPRYGMAQSNMAKTSRRSPMTAKSPFSVFTKLECGEMNTPKWRKARAELEEMFLVPMSEFQLPVSPQRIEGYLVTNGHANSHVEPVMEGWFEEQRRDHGRV